MPTLKRKTKSTQRELETEGEAPLEVELSAEEPLPEEPDLADEN